MTNSRSVAARIIASVLKGQSLAQCLEPNLLTLADARDKALVQALCFGVCRGYSKLNALLTHLLKKPLSAKDTDIQALLCVGLFQLLEMRVPEHAAVAETVNAVQSLGKPWARALVNAVLRQFLRQKDQLLAEVDKDLVAHFAHPLWWIDAIRTAWPADWQEILAANNAHPPFSLRVNEAKISREAYMQELAKHAIAASPLEVTRQGIVLSKPMDVQDLPGFKDQLVHVQDGASQFAASLLQLAPGQRVLDACAAPGGKLVHILESEPQVQEVIAVEKDKKRFQALPAFPKVKSFHADVADLNAWWDGNLFDRILLDAPCSASGVIRRHPDIKLLRQKKDIAKLAIEQSHILKTLWSLLKPGGMFVYATCSIFPEENVAVTQHFLQSTPDAKEELIESNWGVTCAVGKQILPGRDQLDGFYYARFYKLIC